MFRKILLAIAGMAGLLLVVLVVRASMVKSRQLKVKQVSIKVDATTAAVRLSKAVQFKTISFLDPKKVQVEEFLKFHRFLESQFPLVHKHLKREKVNKLSLLYTWKGTDPKLKPVLWLAHQDVVPVEPGTRKLWKQAPFSGKNDGKYIWGRGTLDDKNSILAILEAVEYQLKKGFKPRRTLLLGFGHDEEVFGLQGAGRMAALLKKRGVKLEMVLDEGMVITKKLVPGVNKDVALIGIAEKGVVTLKISVKGKGGHSSMPPRHTALGVLGTALHRMEKNPLPFNFKGPVRRMFEFLGPEMGFGKRLVFSNMWLFQPVILGILKKKKSTRAQIHTTQAITVARAGTKENVLPANAMALANYRILPGDTIRSVQKHVTQAINHPKVKVSVLFPKRSRNPTPVSSTTSRGFLNLQRSIRETFASTYVAPTLVNAATDSSHFVGLTKNVYRFSPFPLTRSDIPRLHGSNERIAIKDYAGMIRFYIRLLHNHHK